MKPNSKYCGVCSKNAAKGAAKHRAMRGRTVCWAHDQAAIKERKAKEV
jgi:hypothetical protein